MGFFEELRKRTDENIDTFEQEYGSATKFIAIEATIEALKEMMVGEPMKAGIEHWHDLTNIHAPDVGIWIWGKHGTEGEQVHVIVVRSGGRKDEPRTEVQALETIQG